MLLILPLLFAVSLAGLAYVFLNAFQAGAEAYTGVYSARTAKQFEDIFLFIPPRRLAEAGWAAAGVCFTLVFFLTANMTTNRGMAAGAILGAVAGGLALQAPRWVLGFLKRRRLQRFNIQLVDSLVNMGNSLKAGFSILQAFESVVQEGENPIAQEFDLFLQETRVGVSFSDALHNLEQRVASEDLTLVAMAIETARRTGGNLTEVLERIASTIRERVRIEGRIRTLTAQGRLQGLVVGVMPLVIGVALMVIDPKLMRPFLHSTAGLLVIVAVATLVACGALVIRRIVNVKV